MYFACSNSAFLCTSSRLSTAGATSLHFRTIGRAMRPDAEGSVIVTQTKNESGKSTTQLVVSQVNLVHIPNARRQRVFGHHSDFLGLHSTTWGARPAYGKGRRCNYCLYFGTARSRLFNSDPLGSVLLTAHFTRSV